MINYQPVMCFSNGYRPEINNIGYESPKDRVSYEFVHLFVHQDF